MPIAHGSTSARNLTIPERLSLPFVANNLRSPAVDLKEILGNVDANSDISAWTASLLVTLRDHLWHLDAPRRGSR